MEQKADKKIVNDSPGKGDVVTVSESSVAGFVSDMLNELNQVTHNF